MDKITYEKINDPPVLDIETLLRLLMLIDSPLCGYNQEIKRSARGLFQLLVRNKYQNDKIIMR